MLSFGRPTKTFVSCPYPKANIPCNDIHLRTFKALCYKTHRTAFPERKAEESVCKKLVDFLTMYCLILRKSKHIEKWNAFVFPVHEALIFCTQHPSEDNVWESQTSIHAVSLFGLQRQKALDREVDNKAAISFKDHNTREHVIKPKHTIPLVPLSPQNRLQVMRFFLTVADKYLLTASLPLSLSRNNR